MLNRGWDRKGGAPSRTSAVEAPGNKVTSRAMLGVRHGKPRAWEKACVLGLGSRGDVRPSWRRSGFLWGGVAGKAQVPGAARRRQAGRGWPACVQMGTAHLVYEHCATQPPPACLLQDGEGAVIPNDHHLHRDARSPGLLPGQAEVEAIPSVVLHDEEGPHYRSSRQGTISACPHCPPACYPGSSPASTPGLPVPAWATALMAARMLPTAGEVNTAPAMTPVSIPFPMKPGDGRGGEKMLGGDLCLLSLGFMVWWALLCA